MNHPFFLATSSFFIIKLHSLKAAFLLENSKKFPAEGHSPLPRLQWDLSTPQAPRGLRSLEVAVHVLLSQLTHAQPLTTVLALAVYSISSSKISNYYAFIFYHR